MPRRILIVDDSPTFLKAISHSLGDEGYVVEEALTPEEAMKKAERTSFDLFIIDINLPGMSGLELLSKIKTACKKEAFASIIITAYGSLDTAVKAMRAGAQDYLTKPLKLDELKDSIRRAFEEKLSERDT